jgi:RNA polymerase sigma-70 factor, ECF subfamily
MVVPPPDHGRDGPTEDGQMHATTHGATTDHTNDVPIDERLAMAFDEHAAALRRYALHIARDPDAADDIVADAFARLFTEAQADRWPKRVGPWLYRVAWNLAMSRGRRMTVAARVNRQMRASFRERVVDSPESLVIRREVGSELDRAVSTLSPDARTAVLLAAEGFDGAAIAATIGRSYAATRTLLCRSRGILRVALAASRASSSA